MWLPKIIIQEVDQVATIRYIDVTATERWNRYRHKDELRLLTGWAWIAKRGGEYRQGFKTQTVAYRDCYYALLRHQSAPGGTGRRRFRVVNPDSQIGERVA
jgi:hypothetical protein